MSSSRGCWCQGESWTCSDNLEFTSSILINLKIPFVIALRGLSRGTGSKNLRVGILILVTRTNLGKLHNSLWYSRRTLLLSFVFF